MPLLHVVSSDDEDRTDRDPNGDGQGGGSQSSPSGQEGRDAGQSDDLRPSQSDQNNSSSNGGQGGNIEANESNGSTRTAASLLRLAQDNALFRKLGFNKFYLLPHTILVKGAGNIIFGSYDKKFPFLSQSKYVPINPLIHVSHVTQEDFKRVGMDDPHVEDINFIIGIAARGNLGEEHLRLLHEGENKVSDELTPSLFKRVMTKVVTFANPWSPRDVLLRPTLNPNLHLSFNRKGWVGKRDVSHRSKCKRLFPWTNSIGPVKRFLYPSVTRAQAYLSSTHLKKVLVHPEYPRRLLEFHGLLVQNQ